MLIINYNIDDNNNNKLYCQQQRSNNSMSSFEHQRQAQHPSLPLSPSLIKMAAVSKKEQLIKWQIQWTQNWINNK